MLKFFKRHKILAILLIIVLLWGIVFMCEYRRSSWYSEEQHIKRVSKRIDNHFKDWKYGNGERYESFKVYPLYEKDDTLQYFLVEFEPFGFVFIYLDKYERRTVILGILSKSMYREGNIYDDDNPWSPYVKDLTKSQPEPHRDKKWILDENGNKIVYTRSPYYITGHINDKKYFIKIESGDYICAVKQGDKFLNLISGLTFDASNDSSIKEQASIFCGFYMHYSFELY